MTEEQIIALGYTAARQLPDGRWLALQQMLLTFGLFVGIDEWGYRSRYCYEKALDAVVDLYGWDGTGDPAGPWIKQKPGDRLNPRLKDEAL